jgi:hypothetical protein
MIAIYRAAAAVETLREALASIDIDENTKFWKGCVNAIIAQHRQGEMIAWPPRFALQSREPEYIEIKLEQTRRYLKEQEQEKSKKPASKRK